MSSKYSMRYYELFETDHDTSTPAELAMDDASRIARAKQMGFDTSHPVHHGTPDQRDIHTGGFATAERRYRGADDGEAYFFTDDLKTAHSYADPSRAFDYQGSEPGVLTCFLRLGNTKQVNWGGKVWEGTREFIAAAKAEGYDSAVITNVVDHYNIVGNKRAPKAATVYVVFDPTRIRSTRAAFDPSQIDSTNIMA